MLRTCLRAKAEGPLPTQPRTQPPSTLLQTRHVCGPAVLCPLGGSPSTALFMSVPLPSGPALRAALGTCPPGSNTADQSCWWHCLSQPPRMGRPCPCFLELSCPAHLPKTDLTPSAALLHLTESCRCWSPLPAHPCIPSFSPSGECVVHDCSLNQTGRGM